MGPYDVAPVDITGAMAPWIGLGQNAQQNQQQQLSNLMSLQQQGLKMAQFRAVQTLLPQAFAPGDQTQVWGQLAGLMDPAAYKALNDHYTTLNTNQQQDVLTKNGQTWSALMNGRSDVAVGLIQDRIDALKKANAEPGQIMWLQDLAKLAQTDPKSAAAQLGTSLAALPGGDKYIDSYYKLAGQPSEIAQREADANNKNADAAKTVATTPSAVALENANAAKALADAAKTNWDMGQIPDAIKPAINAKVDQSNKSAATAFQVEGLATMVDKVLAGQQGGTWASILSSIKKTTGGQNVIDMVKAEYTRLKNTNVLAMLPPGPASDRDIQIAASSWPDENANPTVIASFLRGMAKLSRYDAAYNDAAAQYMSQNNGSLGNASKPLDVNGVPVAPGSTFQNWAKKNLSLETPTSAMPQTITTTKGANGNTVVTVDW